MCLYSNDSGVNNLLRENRGKKSVTVYKVLDKIKGRLESPSFPGTAKWKVGRIKSGVVDTLACNGSAVHNGIHVYLTEQKAKDLAVLSSCRVVIKMRADLANLLGVNQTGDHAVFSSVFFTQNEYDKIFSKKTKKTKKAH